MFLPAPTKVPARVSTRYGAVPEDEEQGIASRGDYPKKQALQQDASWSSIAVGVLLYAFCSSSQLVVNKVAMNVVPDASSLLLCQLSACIFLVNIAACVHPGVQIEKMTWKKAKAFMLVPIVFFLGLLTNAEALKFVTVDTIIVVRSCSPIFVALLERLALGRDLPSCLGIVSLLVIALGAVLYFVTQGLDTNFHLQQYLWLSAYLVSLVVEMVWVKFVVDTVPMATWTRVYYNNLFSLPLVLMSSLVLGELQTPFTSFQWDAAAMLVVGLSCAMGVGLSFATFNLLQSISATSFTIVGIVCKLFAILINDIIGSRRSNAYGHGALFICILAGATFEKVKK